MNESGNSVNLRSLADELPDALVVLDGQRRIRLVNEAAVAMLGHPRSQLEGASCRQLLNPRTPAGLSLLDDSWPASTRLRSVSGFTEQSIHVSTASEGDRQLWVTGRYRRRNDGSISGAVILLRGSRRSREGVRGMEVISTVSHELRSPLTSVKGYTSLLLSRWDKLGDAQKKLMLGQVQHDADRVTRLVGELLDISRLETGRLTLRRQMVDLGVVIDRVVDKVRLVESELSAAVDLAPGFPLVYADPDKVEQVLTNLVENAAKYADPKGMQVVGRLNDSEVSIAVIDKGEGIAARDLPRVFTKFFRRAETRPSGSGLGLWISRGLVEAHGGRLVVESVVGEGSTFRFTLPLAIPEELAGRDESKLN